MPVIEVIGVNHPRLHEVQSLFREYNDFLGFDLCFQGFEEELASLPGKYAAPHGQLYLALMKDEITGCVAFYRLSEGICELKRLYVRPAFQGHGIGKLLMQRALDDAKSLHYRIMRLDSLRRLTSAEPLYTKFGFTEIAAFNNSPLDDVYYMERTL